MKRIFQVLGLLLLLGLGYLAFAGTKMQTITTEIDIAAPPEKVWGILVDVEKWQAWSPVINASSGDAAVGSSVSITMIGKDAGKDGPTYSPEILQLDEPRILHWRAHMLTGFVFTNDKIIELQKTDTGTKLIHKETFKGMMAVLMKGQMEKGVSPILNAMNEALKQQAEQ